ncbi:uncharacterized protein LOC129902472 [Solanum dulcamara]|uniref:uncharacterized protein LOC129902472 n=1 Tax=Solanum dulcamara TaxID=45834 RepID=UPI002486AE5B|nr:uncharacterized protein LOC129902472 [Solanum dulcamara]
MTNNVKPNQMVELTALHGSRLTDSKENKEEIIQFYQGLMGTDSTLLPTVNKDITINETVLIHEHYLVSVHLLLKLRFMMVWTVIKKDIVGAAQDFFETGRLYRAVNCTTITLVPKIPNPQNVKEFRHIACCTIMYKITSKVLDARMQKVIPAIINEAQAGFVPGRRIADNIIMAHELVKAYSRKHISPRCMIKIVIKKAYDSVEWVYLKQILEELRFLEKFVTWIIEYVQTMNYSIIINREPTPPFNVAKGSPYLFVIAMEYLNRTLSGLSQLKTFKFHPRC